ncbi:Stk1 family PASTA domain-containing Ser/Thr kinase [Mammaliicoccus sciuri]|uniref:Stk1 family PASTA domain-containing Ser/Thr kinase n=1 Tax=Mammaliicoccus sciuri TaxID=1296 RepID=UPI0008787D53|nr:Stk1 family PASTA domain-containing Ser/Thr kinase [Mammaliicoccus sciuri]MBF0718980.1 Stk1 family PASTA domain-containing Ser/Thr kinase [Mammaliicoccus sciuri]MCD8762410.1 Stk1 family PASTA domain-containing Ser/Thr kinase [Mammaliicoccus sciuri]MCP1286660.1 Stk1 family PASTA domain-containing Ser/Thr kinase [Mammaliicoccus sciuri]MEB7423852.1 Stk1 family PASTA domain-containing Ser/Thr kinase [Mammaliicoccus sciuri]MEB8104572.1 Stk1 family PASTA domain-containing Ser/Thr kinase [Mammalii
MIGRIIAGRYEFVKYLGGGGMSNVYLAKDKILNRDVAVKVINIPPYEKEKAVERFEREVQNTTILSHSNVVNVLDVEEDDNCYYLVMEYIEGPTLKEYLCKEGKLSADEAVEMTLQILKGIAHAHHHRIIHRDIKPQNILMTKNGTLKILDFGIARALSETALTETNHVMGSVQYLSPEQAKGQSTDESSDIYSIGIVLYELLTGHPPFNGETPVSVAIKHIQEELPSIRKERPSIPQSIENVIMKATRKEKSQRYRDTNEMYYDLLTALDDERKDELPRYDSDSDTKTMPVIKADEEESDTKTVPIATTQQNANAQQQNMETNKPKRKRNKWLIVFVPILLLCMLVGAIGFALTAPKYVDVPNLLGKSRGEALALIDEKGLSKGKITEAYSNSFKEGEVMKVTPKVGSKVKEMTKVDLVISQGVKTFTVEDYVGKSADKTKKQLEKQGFESVRIKEQYDKAENGTVINQNIEPGSKVVPKDTMIILTKSIGVKQEYVKDYTGEEISKATSELEALGFKVEQSEVESDEPADTIVKQSFKDGQLPVESTIYFDVSKGEDKDSNSDKSDKSDDKDKKDDSDDNARDKTYTQSVYIPFTGSDSKKGQKVEIFVKDKSNDIKKVADSFTIKKDTTRSINFTIPKGESAEYRVEVDGKEVESNTIDYDDF